jgi:type II secretory pathway pseudopilin PulG
VTPSGVPRAEEGFSLVELIVAMGVIVAVAGIATPLTAKAVDASRARQGAGLLAARIRAAKLDAVSRAASVALVFDLVGPRWTFRVCADGNGNGVRRSELSTTDRCLEGPFDIQALFPGVQIAVDATIRGPDGEPGSSDAVRFGKSDLVSCSATGGCTSGSVFLRSSLGDQYLVRVAGVTGRTRILQYDGRSRTWREI